MKLNKFYLQSQNTVVLNMQSIMQNIFMQSIYAKKNYLEIEKDGVVVTTSIKLY